jgi:plastocyanin
MRRHAVVSPYLLGSALLVLAVGLAAAPAASATREFSIVTGEWSWKASAGEAAVPDRDRGPVKEIERYTFDPGFIVVDKGDTVTLRIHTLKGSQHLVEIPAFGVAPTPIARGQEKALTFVADKAGVFEFRCNMHHNAHSEGPMAGYIYVNGR